MLHMRTVAVYSENNTIDTNRRLLCSCVVQQVTLHSMAGVCACVRAQYFWIFCYVSWNDSSVLIAKQTAGPSTLCIWSVCSLDPVNRSCRRSEQTPETHHGVLALPIHCCVMRDLLDSVSLYSRSWSYSRQAEHWNIGKLQCCYCELQQLHWFRLKITLCNLTIVNLWK
jgi:hypothetical protein